MAQYVDKDALVAEIENILDYADEHWDTDYAIGAKRFADKLQDTIDTLEVKEVDFDALVDEAFDKYSSVDGYGQLAVSFNRAELYSFIKKIARKEE